MNKSEEQTLIDELIQASDMSVDFRVAKDEPLPTGIRIKIRGDLARIPAIKNNKQIAVNSKTGKTFIKSNPKHIAHMKALTILWQKITGHMQPIRFNQKLSMAVIYGVRSGTWDEDNCKTTLKDWLEPSEKQKGGTGNARGWGIGLIEDDSLVKAYDIKSSELRIEQEFTTIFIEPWDRAKHDYLEFISKRTGEEHAAI